MLYLKGKTIRNGFRIHSIVSTGTNEKDTLCNTVIPLQENTVIDLPPGRPSGAAAIIAP